MEIKSYNKQYSDAVKMLHQGGVLDGYPRQGKRGDLRYAEGIDIEVRLKGMTPAKFKEYSEILLWVAYEEAKRYIGEQILFAKFTVRLNRNEKGRKTISQPVREYTARGNTDPKVLVFGKEALGYVPTHFIQGKEVELKASLADKAEEILNLTEKYMKDFLQKQRPYKVLSMTICIRKKY